jgi:hypothetical protein
MVNTESKNRLKKEAVPVYQTFHHASIKGKNEGYPKLFVILFKSFGVQNV